VAAPPETWPAPADAKHTGRTEEIIGNWLQKHPERRRELVLATKVSGPMPVNFVSANREKALSGTADKDAPLPRLVPDQILHAVRASLARLKTGYIDLLQVRSRERGGANTLLSGPAADTAPHAAAALARQLTPRRTPQLHWPDRYTPLWGHTVYLKSLEQSHQQQQRPDGGRTSFDEVVQCLGELLAQGTIRAWGLSNETSFGVCAWAAACARNNVAMPVSIQNDFSLLDRRFESELAETCSDINHGVRLLAYGALCGGTLSDKGYTEGSRHKLYPAFQARYHCPASQAASAKYAAIARAAGLSPATLALAWAYSRHYMGAVIVGATSTAQLLENIAAVDVELPKAVLSQIDAVHCEARNPNLRN
jgi:aryl-alcohol dehydrogenase-like predicted oxidoreductase